MIIRTLISLILDLIKGIFTILPSIPALPDSAINSIDTIVDVIFNGWGLFTFFVRPQTVYLLIPIAVSIVSFEHLYKLIMWIIRKIPFINVS